MSLLDDAVDNPNGAKNRILSAAGAIFAEKGFRRSTVREICEAADVNIASVNYYFGDKKNLYAETLLLAREMGAVKFPTPNFSSLPSAEDRLQQMTLLLINRLVANQTEPWPVKILMAEILSPSPAAIPLIDGYIRPFMDALFGTVEELLNDSASKKQIQQVGFSVVAQCLYYRFAGDINKMVVGEESYEANFTVNELAKQIFDFSLAGIRNLNQQLINDRPKSAVEVVQSAWSPV